MKKLFFLAAVATMTLASCMNDEFVGAENSPTVANTETDAINFGFKMQNATRADIYGKSAADLLGSGFYVTGTKGKEQATYPSPNLVFDNYLVHYDVNTAGTTESNTANWEYVGVTPGTAPYANWVKLAETATTQTIKYWDYSTDQYDFLAFSTGNFKAVKKTDVAGETITTDDDVNPVDEIGVTKMLFGAGLAGGTTAYTFYIPTIDALKDAYITDITTVGKSSYGNEVMLQFKNLGSKIRVALYETVPGYSVQAGSVKFYTADESDEDVIASVTPGPSHLGASSTKATLITANTSIGFPERGKIAVSFPNVGTGNSSNQNYKKASVSVTPKATVSPKTYQEFGTLAADKYATAEGSETPAGASYLGRSLPQATYAGVAAVDYYELVFPVSSTDAKPLTLRVDYTLISTDGSGETINVYGAKAVVPATFTVWQPNYAYTYVFKISDNTNGWTTQTATTDNQGLYPITFDAVVAEMKDVSGEQTTITTVATPTITTYQQNHDKANNEYSIATGKNVYVQVMDNKLSPAVLVGTSPSILPKLNSTSPFTASLLYAVTSGQTYATQPADWPTGYYTDAVCNTAATSFTANTVIYYKRCTEADVMDALQNQTSVDGSGNITGRNGVVLTKNSNITTTGDGAGNFDIENGADDKKITVPEGDAAKIVIGSLSAGTYAYVYDYSGSKTTKTIYQSTGQTSGAIADGKKYITTATLKDVGLTTAANEAPEAGYVYFSKTTTDGTNYTYGFVSVEDKTELPAGLVKVSISTDCSTSNGSAVADANTFVFTTYTRNDGKYAVKVIKVVN